MLAPLYGILKQIANDSTDEQFQRKYDEFVQLSDKIAQVDLKGDRENMPQFGGGHILQDLRQEQNQRSKAENDIDLLLIGSKQSILQKDQKIKELELLLQNTKSQLADATSKSATLSKTLS